MRRLGIAQHLQGADGFLRGGGVEWLYLLATGGRRGDGRRRAGVFLESGELATQVDEDALCGLQANPLDRLERLDLSERDDARQLVRGVRAEDDTGGIRPDTRDGH